VQLDLGSLQIELAQWEEALMNLAAAVDSLRQLADGPAPGRFDANLLLLGLSSQGDVLLKLARAEEAEEASSEGAERARKLLKSAQDRPVVPDKNMQHALARLLLLASQACLNQPESADKAAARLAEAVAIWEELADRWRDNPLAPIYRSYLGRAINQRGHLQLSQNQLGLAAADFHEATELFQSLQSTLPETSAYLASTLANQARLALRRKDPMQAKVLLQQAIEMQTEVLAKVPESGAAQRELEVLQAELEAIK
jgi:tetratricopeptide (TPR) repeat protein